MINKVILIGNLGRDPEIRYLEGGTAVARFSVATNENYRDRSGNWQTRTEWHDIVAWRQLAERVEKMLKKGSMVYIEGKLTHRKWQDSEGKDRYTTEVVANVLRLLDKKDTDEMSGMGSGPSTANTGSVSSTPDFDKPDNSGEDDDLPF